MLPSRFELEHEKAAVFEPRCCVKAGTSLLELRQTEPNGLRRTVGHVWPPMPTMKQTANLAAQRQFERLFGNAHLDEST